MTICKGKGPDHVEVSRFYDLKWYATNRSNPAAVFVVRCSLGQVKFECLVTSYYSYVIYWDHSRPSKSLAQWVDAASEPSIAVSRWHFGMSIARYAYSVTVRLEFKMIMCFSSDDKGRHKKAHVDESVRPISSKVNLSFRT